MGVLKLNSFMAGENFKRTPDKIYTTDRASKNIVIKRRKIDGRRYDLPGGGAYSGSPYKPTGEGVEGFLQILGKVITAPFKVGVAVVKGTVGIGKYFIPGLGQYWLVRDLRKRFTSDKPLMKDIQKTCSVHKTEKERKACIEKKLRESKHAKDTASKYSKSDPPEKAPAGVTPVVPLHGAPILPGMMPKPKAKPPAPPVKWITTPGGPSRPIVDRSKVVVKDEVGDVGFIPIIGAILSIVIGGLTDMLSKKMTGGQSLETISDTELAALEQKQANEAAVIQQQSAGGPNIMAMVSKYWWIVVLPIVGYVGYRGLQNRQSRQSKRYRR